MSECLLWEGDDGCFGRSICVGCDRRLEALREELATAEAERDRLRDALRALCLHADEWRANGWVPATGALDDAHAALGVKP